MNIGWNPITKDWDKLYKADFLESQRYNTADVKSYKGKKAKLDPNRENKEDVWEEESERIYWPWEPNS